MIRIIFLSLLTLTISCANTRPEAHEKGADQTAAPTTPAPEPAQPATTPEKKGDKPQTTKQTISRAVRKQLRRAVENASTPIAASETSAPIDSVVTMQPARQTPIVIPQPEITVLPATDSVRTYIPVRTNTPADIKPLDSENIVHKRFLPTRRRIDREINKLKFAYKGEVMMGMTASYGTLSSDDTDIMLILDNIDASGTIASVKPFIGYFYRDNNCVGVRFGYNHMGGTVDNLDVDIDQANDMNFNVPYLDLNSDNYSFGIFHRSYAGLDPKGRFGLFAEFELSVSTGTSNFTYRSDDINKSVFSDNTQVKLSFNPGAAVYIFPNVCATLSFGLGGLEYTSIKQKDENGNEVGSRKSSKMKFKLNIAAINIGMTIHLWDKKKQ